MHPFEAEGYREAMRALRNIGRDCIKKRIEMVKSGEKVPNDILTQILQMAGENVYSSFCGYSIQGSPFQGRFKA